ncbi:MAG TPA: hypothetical protein VGI81_13200 [Tepidisphaeraceae bacterium]
MKFAIQQRMMNAVRALDGCAAEGKPWASSGPLVGTIYPSDKGTPFVSLISPGGHQFPAEPPGADRAVFQGASEGGEQAEAGVA